MDTRPARMFPTYFAMSAMCTTICLYHLWQDPSWKQRAFVERIKLSRMGTVIIGNMAFASLLLFYKLILWLFFGSITLMETQKMWQKLVNYMVFNLLAVSAILDPRLDVVLKWGAWLFLMASMRLLCDLARNRFKSLITYTPNAAWYIHGKIVALLVFLMFVDLAVFAWALHVSEEFTKDQLFLVVSECFSLAVVATGALIKYIIYFIDIGLGGAWENRGAYSYYTDFFSKSIILTVSLVYYATILHMHGISLNIFFDILIIIRLVVIFVSMRAKIIAYRNYRHLTNQLNSLYSPLTPEEIANYNDDCAICRDPMETALKLPCGHIFHSACLRSWLEHNHNCPTCRHVLIAQSPPTSARNTSNNGSPTQGVNQAAQTHNTYMPQATAMASHLIPSHTRTTTNLNQYMDRTGQQASTSSNIISSNIPSTSENLSSSNNPSSSNSVSASNVNPSSVNIPSSHTLTAENVSQTSIPAHSRITQQHPSTTTQQHPNSTLVEEELQGEAAVPVVAPQSVWSFSSPTWLGWLPSLSVEVMRGQDPGIGHMEQNDLTVHREMLEQVLVLFPDIPENIALADLLVTKDVHETINNIIENRLSWSPETHTPAQAPNNLTRPITTSSPSTRSSQNSSGPITQSSTPPSARSSTSPSAQSSASVATNYAASPSSVTASSTTPALRASSPAGGRTSQTNSPLRASTPSSSAGKLVSTRATVQLSYEERKQRMIEQARKQYLEKMSSSSSSS